MAKHSTHIKQILTSTERTSSSASDLYNVEQWSELALFINLTGSTGTSPTLDFVLQQTTASDSTTYYDWPTIGEHASAAMPQVTTTGQHLFLFSNIGNWIRLKWTVEGTSTPGYTFSAFYVLKT